MSTYDAAAFAAYNKDLREIRSRISFAFQKENVIVFDSDNMVVSWSISRGLTDTINTPFDNCCSDTCTCTVYNRYTGTYAGQDVVDFKLFDPLKNPDADLNIRFVIQVSAKQDDGNWSPWKTVGIFYTTSIQIDDNRQTANIRGDDILSLLFNKTLPRMPVLRDISYKKFITAFCAEYNLPVEWHGNNDEKMKYAFCQKTTKDTIQGLVKSAVSVAYIDYDDEDNEVLKVVHFSVFEDQPPFEVTDVDNGGREDTVMQLISLSYNKTLQSYNTKTRVVYYLPSNSDITQEYSYTAEDLDDFVYNSKDKQYVLNVSRAEMSQGPLISLNYASVVLPYEENNFKSNIRNAKATQYTLTSQLRYNNEAIPDEYTYTAAIHGQYVNCESQQLPEDTPDVETQDITEYITVDFPYVQNRLSAIARRQRLEAWCFCTLQTIDVQLRYNPYVALGDAIRLETQVYDIGEFTGVLWSQTITYNSGGLSSQATLVNRDALIPGVDIYDVAGYQGAQDTGMSYIYSVGILAKKSGIWRAPVHGDTVGNNDIVGKLNANFSDAAITFDGQWTLGADNLWTLITEEEPWVFMVIKGVLYAQHGLSGTRQPLTDPNQPSVLFVAAERGYFPGDFAALDTDQGVIVAYLTAENKLYYKTYVNTSTGRRWLDAEEIELGPVGGITGLQIHRLNDYRIGIVVSTSTGNHWLITERIYSQMAIRPEHFTLSSPSFYPVFPFAVRTDRVNVMPQPTLQYEINDEHTCVTITSNMPWLVYPGFDVKTLFSGTATMPQIASIDIDDKVLKVNFAAAARATFTINSKRNIYFTADITGVIPGGGTVVVEPMSATFEIFLANEYQENFTIEAPELNKLSVSVAPILDIYNTTTEHFKVDAPQLTQLSVIVKDARVTNYGFDPENFTVIAPTINTLSITVDGINVDPI